MRETKNMLKQLPKILLAILLTATPALASPYRADLLLKLGNRQLNNGQLTAALTTLKESLKLYQEIDNRTGQANTLLRLGEINFTLGKYQTAINLYQQSLNLLQDTGNQPTTVQILELLSNAYINTGDEKLAQEFREKAAALRKEIGNPPREASFLGNVGIEHEKLGEYQQAIAFHTQQLTIGQETKNRELQIYSLQNLAAVHRELKQYPQAISFYERVLKIASQSSDLVLTKITLKHIAQTYENQGNFDQAIALYQQQLETSKNPENKADLIKQLGRVYTSAKQYDQALALYQEQLDTAKANKDIYTQAAALNNLAFVLLKSGKVTEAQTTLQTNIKTWESLRANLGNTIDYSTEQTNTYSLLQQVFVNQNQPEAALEVAEQSSLMAILNLLGMRLATESAGSGLKAAPKEIILPTITQIQEVAKQEQATIVRYSLIEDNEIYVWVIQPSGKVTFRKIDLKLQKPIIPFNSLAELINKTPMALGVKNTKPPADNYKNLLLQLNQILIKPIADLLPKNPTEQVIFIPQNELWFVPFPALVDIYGKYLIEKNTITSIPAIQLLKLTRQKRNNTGGSKVVVVGNPTMPKVAQQSLPQLVNAEQEALELADLLKTTALVGNQATKADILPLLPKAKTIHLATYAVLDDTKRQGIPGAIALASVGDNNGLLTASEILNLYTQPKGQRLRARLVFLSAGETGNGSIGNGVLGLSLALINAGVPSVIISQWAAPDTPTNVFTTEFYRQLKQNPNKAQALRNAMLTTMKQHPNPKDWAAFTLIGEAR
ncbi:CHAT domain-containing protein [Anabaena minutissima FACHB-250]|nr:CHAT domain-containing protein [Anabaena minutissima FACHB-250]